ncbi:Bug family tripartite tricarboxylate transporter substrate binding protein [Falsigemmobacter intermedius]|uniref:Tripartite tricarboxylate transporter substrate binding protein n=1 Tax=Falsigemmobacter intermedius TaxID=1553448 RepID=A0A3S3WMS5_9RHOB|nr:tripartite tricarboxylate transporter substrate binding protein [Falsigemmobacter intermedius]RWY40983.1 tripartite tricarboxylate transporter substrate binding protein [Falsigemmobacter intermedius]
MTGSARMTAVKSALLGTLIAAGTAFGAMAQDFPSKPIVMVVPFPPGGSTDVVSRVLAQKMGEKLKQTIVVENKPGAAGTIGIGEVARSAADGYTVGVSGVGPSIILHALGQQLSYDPTKDLEVVGLAGSTGFVLAARPDFPADDLGGVLAWAKENPGKLAYGTSGVGSPGHLAMEWLRMIADVEVNHIPYKGNGPLLTDVIGKHIDMGVLTIPGTAKQVNEGQIKALAVTGAARSQELETVPTVAELGHEGYAAEIWNALVVPTGTPEPVVETLAKALDEVMADPATQAEIVKLGFTPNSPGRAASAEFIEAERAKWTEVIKNSGAKLE